MYVKQFLRKFPCILFALGIIAVVGGFVHAADINEDTKEKTYALTEAQLQSHLMSFADRFASIMDTTIAKFENLNPSGKSRYEVLELMTFSLHHAFIIAGESDPNVALLDMVSMVTLGRIFFEEEGQLWAEKIKKCLLEAKVEKEKSKDVLSNKRIQYYRSRLKRILREGFKLNPENVKKHGKRGRPGQTKSFNLLRRFRDYINDVFRFITKLEVPFDNNPAERDIRMMKVQQKISGTFRSLEGALNFCIIRSYISSIKKNGQSVFDSLQSIFQGCIMTPKTLKIAE